MVERRKATRGKTKPSTRERPGEYVGFRSPTELKEKLEKAAAVSGRSLSSEVQFRLENSFKQEETAKRTFVETLRLMYGPRVAGLILVLARALSEVGPQAAFFNTSKLHNFGAWLDEPYAYSMATQAITRILELGAPEGDPKPSQQFTKMLPENHHLREFETCFGSGFANGIVDAATGRGATTESIEWGATIAELLGDLGVRMHASLKEKREKTS